MSSSTEAAAWHWKLIKIQINGTNTDLWGVLATIPRVQQLDVAAVNYRKGPKEHLGF